MSQRSYVHAVAKLGRFFGRSPDKLDLEDVRAFRVHLVACGISGYPGRRSSASAALRRAVMDAGTKVQEVPKFIMTSAEASCGPDGAEATETAGNLVRCAQAALHSPTCCTSGISYRLLLSPQVAMP